MKTVLLCLLSLLVLSCSDNPTDAKPEVPAVVRNVAGTWLLHMSSTNSVREEYIAASDDEPPYMLTATVSLYAGDWSYVVSRVSGDSIFAQRFLESWAREDIALRLVGKDSIAGRVSVFEKNGADYVPYSHVDFHGVRKR